MRQKIIKFRGFQVTKRELIADAIFLIVAGLISLFALYIFDIHWSFYPGETILPPSKIIGLSSNVYLVGSLIGAIAGLFLIKLFLIGVEEEIKINSKQRRKK